MKIASFTLAESLIALSICALVLPAAYFMFSNLSHLEKRTSFQDTCARISSGIPEEYYGSTNFSFEKYFSLIPEISNSISWEIQTNNTELVLHFFRTNARKTYHKKYYIHRLATTNESSFIQ